VRAGEAVAFGIGRVERQQVVGDALRLGRGTEDSLAVGAQPL